MAIAKYGMVQLWQKNFNRSMTAIALGLALLSLTIWIILLGFRGQFWRANQRLDVQNINLESWPNICAIIPARNEADLLPVTLRSLFNQNYPGNFHIILVDDNSTDGTGDYARGVAYALDKISQLDIVFGEALPPGWSGKLWAVAQGIKHAEKLNNLPDYFLITDADIQHHSTNLRELVIKSQVDNVDLVSLMVLLRCESFWEKLLIPAFVFFFQKLYPFPWVNNPQKTIAAAAGGCMLIRRETLQQVGGIEIIKQALIDDCALGQAVKSQGNIWLGLTNLTRSLRPYPNLSTIWDMVARSAFTQLNYSSLLLLGTLIGMSIIYIVSPVSAILGIINNNWLIAIVGLLGWLLMGLAYLPTIKLYGISFWWAFSLPIIAVLYTLMTFDSAWRHWQGKGGAWKGRVYNEKIMGNK